MMPLVSYVAMPVTYCKVIKKSVSFCLYKLAHGIYSQFHAIFGRRFAYWENYANFVG